ncbi:UNVERIFIED_CONTAM: hypothetical protein RMT77_016109 [Armadillidium vulgare]
MVSSLKNLCGIPAVLVFSIHEDFRNEIFRSSCANILTSSSEIKSFNDRIQTVITEVLKNFNPVFKTLIPRSLFLVIGIQILKFAEDLQSSFDIPLKFTKEFMNVSFFTSKLKIDEEKFVRELVKDPSLGNFTKYKIACKYYFTDIAESLWQQLRENDPTFETLLSKHHPRSPVVVWSEYFEKLHCSSTPIEQIESLSSDLRIRVLNYNAKDSSVSAVKLGFIPEFKKIICDSKNASDKSKKILEDYLQNIFQFFDTCILSGKVLFLRFFVVHRDIIMLLVSVLGNDNMASFLHRYKIVYSFLICHLMWPFQDLFLSAADSVFHILSGEHFYRILHNIVDMIQDPILRHTYNYPLLLSEFWMKSPSHLKKYVFEVESEKINFNFCKIRHLKSTNNIILHSQIPKNIPREKLRWLLLHKILMVRNFSAEDVQNCQLILESATQQEKEEILYNQGGQIIDDLLRLRNVKLVGSILKSLGLDDDATKTFIKKYTVVYFANYTNEKSLFKVADQFLNVFFNSDEITEIKKEILPQILDSSCVAFELLNSRCIFKHFNGICKFFDMTNEQIKEQYENGVFDEILRNALPKIVMNLYLKKLDKIFYRNLLKNCFNDMENVSNFIDDLREFCEYYKEENICVFCEDDENVTFNDEESRHMCEKHYKEKIFNSESVDEICSYFSEQLFQFLSRKKRRKLLKYLSTN